MANGMFKMKMDIDRHGPRLMPNNCQHLDPPYFSFQLPLKSVYLDLKLDERKLFGHR